MRQNKIQSTSLQHIIATALTFGATVDQISKLDLAYAPPYAMSMDGSILAWTYGLEK